MAFTPNEYIKEAPPLREKIKPVIHHISIMRRVSRKHQKNQTHNNLYLWPNRRNFGVVMEIVVDEHNGYVRFYTVSGNVAISCNRNASGDNYRNSSFIVD